MEIFDIMKLGLGKYMALIGAIIAPLSLNIMAYSLNIPFGIFISGLIIMAFGFWIMPGNSHKDK